VIGHSTRRLASGPLQVGFEFRMFGRAQALLQHVEQLREITAQERGRVEPQAGEDRAAQDSIVSGRKPPVLRLAQDEPVDLPIVDAPDDVFSDAVSLIRLELVVDYTPTGRSGTRPDRPGRQSVRDLETREPLAGTAKKTITRSVMTTKQ